jgi:hypothetical protein
VTGRAHLALAWPEVDDGLGPEVDCDLYPLGTVAAAMTPGQLHDCIDLLEEELSDPDTDPDDIDSIFSGLLLLKAQAREYAADAMVDAFEVRLEDEAYRRNQDWE